MNPNLKWKALFIVAVILLCLYGLLGLPEFPTSWGQAKENFSRRIKLGLDLQGGTHLILQVQVQEAVSLETDQAVDRLTTQLRDKNIPYEEIRKVDDTHILMRNIAPEKSAAFRDLMRDFFPDWDLVPAPGEASGYLLTMRPTKVADIQKRTMDQSEETIRRRIDALGLTEPVIQQHGRGENEILVQLPGEGDPTRAKAVIQAGGQLELRRVADPTTYPTQAAALAAHGGVLPPGTELVRGRSTSGDARSSGEVWYVLDRTPIVTGRDLRSANEQRSTKNPGYYEVQFNLSNEAARRFGPFTEQNVGRQMAIVLEHRVDSAPVINSRIDDSGVIEGRFGQQEAHDLALELRAAGFDQVFRRAHGRAVAWCGFDPARFAGLAGEPGRGHAFHGYLLPGFGRERGGSAGAEPGHPACGAGLFRRRADLAGYRWGDSDDWHGR